MPAGTATRSRFVRCLRPSPLHSSHGESTILPSPRQRGQAMTLTIWPSIVCRAWRISPRPPHWGQDCVAVPLFAPLPEQVAQRSRSANSISFSVPRIDSSKVIRRS